MKLASLTQSKHFRESRPARGAWIETPNAARLNLIGWSRPARGAWIETSIGANGSKKKRVAPRAGRVD